MSTTEDFEELFEFLNEHGVEFLVIGAHAVAFHAKPRYTKDIDLFVASTEQNARRILEALDDFGFGGLGLEPEDFTEPDRVVQLGVPPNRVDFVTSIEAVEFEDAWRNRVEGEYGDVSVWFIGRHDLLQNKRAVGRDQDAMDVSWLEQASEGGDD